jgi:ribosomal protein S18 acetylase RimI-like enzyme
VNVVVRRAAVDDAPLIASLNSDVQSIHAAALPWRFKPVDQGSYAKEVAAFLAKPEILVFIAEVAGDPAGYAHTETIRRLETALTFAYEMILIQGISVRPAYRRRGVGAALIESVRAAGRELGIELIALDVWKFNDDAREFFRRQGFNVYNERLWNRQ